MRNSHQCLISSLSFTAGDWFSADYNHKEIEWLNPRAHNLSILESLLNPSPPSPSQLHNWLIFYPVLPSLNDFTGLPATSLVRFCNTGTYFKMLPGLSGKEPLHNLIARNNVRFPKAFFYRSRLCLSLGTLPEPSAYASGSSQKSSEVAILRFAFDQSLSLIIPCGLCVSDQMVRACALRDCLDVSRPFLSDTSPKCIDREGLGRRRTGKIHYT